MIQRSDIVGRRIANILGDTSLSDDSINFCDFIYQTDRGHCFRMPYNDETGDLLPAVTPGLHLPVSWPRGKLWHYRWRLWTARIADVLVPANADERFLDTGVIALTSGWYIVQFSGAPIGIMPCVDIVPKLAGGEPMISVWSVP